MSGMIAMIRADTAVMTVMTGMIGAVIAEILWWGTEKNQ
jgi:putative effector of murein hydrolase